MAVKDFYHIRPIDLEAGDELLAVVKAIITHIDDEGNIYYRLYRCKYNYPEDIPQGSRVFINEEEVAQAILPILNDAKVDP